MRNVSLKRGLIQQQKNMQNYRFSVDCTHTASPKKESPRRFSEDITRSRPFSYMADPPTPTASISDMIADFDLPPYWASLSHQQLVFELFAISDAHLDKMRLFIQWVIKPATRTHRDIVLNRHQEKSILKQSTMFFTASPSPVPSSDDADDMNGQSSMTRFVQFIPSSSPTSPLIDMFSRRSRSSRRPSIHSCDNGDYEPLLRSMLDMPHHHNALLTVEEATELFSEFVGLYRVQQQTTELIRDVLSSGASFEVLDELLLKRVDRFHLYLRYFRNYSNALRVLDTLQRENADWNTFIQHTFNNRSLKGTHFLSYLILPMQFFPKFFVLLAAILPAPPSYLHHIYVASLEAPHFYSTHAMLSLFPRFKNKYLAKTLLASPTREIYAVQNANRVIVTRGLPMYTTPSTLVICDDVFLICLQKKSKFFKRLTHTISSSFSSPLHSHFPSSSPFTHHSHDPSSQDDDLNLPLTRLVLTHSLRPAFVWLRTLPPPAHQSDMILSDVRVTDMDDRIVRPVIPNVLQVVYVQPHCLPSPPPPPPPSSSVSSQVPNSTTRNQGNQGKGNGEGERRSGHEDGIGEGVGTGDDDMWNAKPETAITTCSFIFETFEEMTTVWYAMKKAIDDEIETEAGAKMREEVVEEWKRMVTDSWCRPRRGREGKRWASIAQVVVALNHKKSVIEN